jgi:hypothetical protein
MTIETVNLTASDFLSAEETLNFLAYATAYYNIRYMDFMEAKEEAQEMANERGHVMVLSSCRSSEGEFLGYTVNTIQDCREFGRAQETFVYPNN